MRCRIVKYNCFQLSGVKNYSLVKPILRISGILIFLLTSTLVSSQEVNNELEYRSELNLSYKLNKKIKLSFIPEIRFNESFNTDKYLFEGGVAYNPVKFIRLKGTYRYVINPRTEKETEYFNKYALSVKVEKELGRFNSGFIIKYTNDADDDITDEQFLRYKLSFDYNIPKCKFTPEIGLEAFQQLGTDGGMYKMRYLAGIDYKIFRNNYLSLVYKFDYHYTQYLNKHIIGIGYKIKF